MVADIEGRGTVKRRNFMSLFSAVCVLPWGVRAQELVSEPAIVVVTRGAKLSRGRVHLEMPVIADNGNAVPLRVTVESPMTAADRVRAIHLVSDRNPVRNMASFHFGPMIGRAELSTRVRLAGSQNVTAIAEMADGTFWMDRLHIQVTLSACVDDS